MELKPFLRFLLYLNIYILSNQFCFGQNFTYQIKAQTTTEQTTIDSLFRQYRYSNLLEINSAADSLAKQLNRIGYINQQISKPEKLNDSVFQSHAQLGVQYKWLKIYYPESQLAKASLENLFTEVTDQYFVIPFNQLEASLKKINNNFAKQGKPFSGSQLVNIQSIKNNTLSAALVINPGEQRTLDQILVKGYDKFPKSYIKYYAGLKTGKPFDQQKITTQYTAISSLPFINSLKPPEVLFKEDSTSVYFYLEKKSSNSFDGIIGFSNTESDSKITFNGYLDLLLQNNLNFGESLELLYKSDGREQQNFRVKVSLPYLFSTPLGADLELYIFKRDSSFLTVEQKITGHYQLNPKTRIFAGYKNYESNNLQDELLSGQTIDDYRANFVLGGINYKLPQDKLLFPVKTQWELYSQVGKRTSSVSSDQIKLGFDGWHIFNLNSRNSVFIRNTTQSLISDNYLENELLRFGGINSIRGFDENSINAQLYSVLNTEYRYVLNPGLYVHSIIDVGYVENQLIDLKEELLSFGIGLGFASKAGIFRLNIANGKTQSIPFSFSNTKIHLSLRSNF